MKQLVCSALCLLALGCMNDPLNGTVVSDPVKGKSLTAQGFYPKPSIPIEVQVLKTPASDPTVAANWELLGTTLSSTTPLNWNSTDPIYSWSKSVVPVPSNATAAQLLRWPSGKLVRLRAVAKDPTGDRTLVVFDEATWNNCFDDHVSESWSDLGLACASPFSPVAVVSSLSNPANAPHDYLGKKGDVTPLQTSQYYLSINAPKDLPTFKSTYGFPAGEVTATYYNDADLGFGREMHCRSFLTLAGLGVACYVRNYGNATGQANFPADPTSALNLATTGHGYFATVAMVYTPPNGSNAVKFMVYGPESTGEKLATTAQLDGTGEHVSIPNNCLSCHGISSTVGTSSVPLPNTPVVSSGARFLPFDFYTFKFSTAAGFTQAAQEDDFEKLNQLVALTPMTTATSTFLKGMYGGVMPGAAGATPNDRYVFPAWDTNKTDRTIHEGVMKPFCRGCHLTSTKASLDFDDPAEFSGDYACNASHVMPHAQHVLRRFWNSGARAYLSQRYDLAASGDCSP
ncbi:MAG: hypothetical protein ACOZQL_41900 [Myxococcota bacterium]